MANPWNQQPKSKSDKDEKLPRLVRVDQSASPAAAEDGVDDVNQLDDQLDFESELTPVTFYMSGTLWLPPDVAQSVRDALSVASAQVQLSVEINDEELKFLTADDFPEEEEGQ